MTLEIPTAPGPVFDGRGDDLYEALLLAHDGLDGDESRALDARLVLLLMAEVADADRVLRAIAAARRSLTGRDVA